jgi:hypothetical protein
LHLLHVVDQLNGPHNRIVHNDRPDDMQMAAREKESTTFGQQVADKRLHVRVSFPQISNTDRDHTAVRAELTEDIAVFVIENRRRDFRPGCQ